MNPAITANQSDWSAFLNPDAAAAQPHRFAFPRLQNGPFTRSNTGRYFSLLGNGHVSIASTPGLVIHARRGTLWITQARDADDHVVLAGERFIADRAGRLVISAFARGEVELEWPSRKQERPETAYDPAAVAA
jgi:Protein of unknown function (DUF2917)